MPKADADPTTTDGDRGRTPDHSPSTTRRGLLRGAAAIAATGAVAAVPALADEPGADADAAIVALVDKIMADHAEAIRLEEEFEERHPRADFRTSMRFRQDKIAPLVRRGWNMRAELASMQATTLAGFRAKAVLVQTFNNCEAGYTTGYEDDALAWSLANDLLGVPSILRQEYEARVAAERAAKRALKAGNSAGAADPAGRT